MSKWSHGRLLDVDVEDLVDHLLVNLRQLSDLPLGARHLQRSSLHYSTIYNHVMPFNYFNVCYGFFTINN